MHPELNSVVDCGVNTLSPHVEVKEIPLNAFITFIRCAQDRVFIGLGNGTVKSYMLSEELDSQVKEGFAVGGLPICASLSSSGRSLLVGTDKSTLVDLEQGVKVLARLEKGWVEQIAVATSGLVAYSSNKTCFVNNAGEIIFRLSQSEGTITGLNFSQDGSTLAIAHYGGVSLWRMSDGKHMELLEWSGAHLNMSWSPDGNYLVTATPDKEIHCWDMQTRGNFRMRGYPSKIRSLCWSADGKHLAAAGADSVTVWPFINGNPSGKPPYEFGYSFQGVVTEVAAHPSEPIVAAGYNNGTVLIGKYLKGEAIIARSPIGVAISAMAWSPDGSTLFAGTETGEFNRIDLKDLDF